MKVYDYQNNEHELLEKTSVSEYINANVSLRINLPYYPAIYFIYITNSYGAGAFWIVCTLNHPIVATSVISTLIESQYFTCNGSSSNYVDIISGQADGTVHVICLDKL